MRTVLAIAIAFFCLCAATTLAHGASKPLRFLCKEVADNARDNEITLRLSATRAEVANYWGDSRKDQGTLKSNKANGDRVYKGFPYWVDDGVEGSGYLFVSKRLLKGGKGRAALYNRYCDESCTTRSAKLDCKASQ